MSSAEQNAKRAKLDSGGNLRTTRGSAKPPALIREDLNEDFWNKLAAEEARRKRLYPHPVVDSPWKTGAAAAPRFKFTRPAQQLNQDLDTTTVRTNKRKLYNTSNGPQEL